MIDGDGAVIGISTAGSKLDQNLFYAVSSSEVKFLLDRNNIPYSLYEAEGIPAALYAGAGAAVIVVIVVLVVVMGKKKKLRPPPRLLLLRVSQRDCGQKGSPVLRSMAPQHGGMVVQLRHQPRAGPAGIRLPAVWFSRTERRGSAPGIVRFILTSRSRCLL